MSENIDIVVVGGGPAGLAAAGAAASQGVRVHILERHNEIGYPIHTSGGSWISDMQALSIPERLSATCRPCPSPSASTIQ